MCNSRLNFRQNPYVVISNMKMPRNVFIIKLVSTIHYHKYFLGFLWTLENKLAIWKRKKQNSIYSLIFSTSYAYLIVCFSKCTWTYLNERKTMKRCLSIHQLNLLWIWMLFSPNYLERWRARKEIKVCPFSSFLSRALIAG